MQLASILTAQHVPLLPRYPRTSRIGELEKEVEMLKAEVMRLMRLLKVHSASHPGRDQAASSIVLVRVQGHLLTSGRGGDAACHG